jgi:hypothetical protein
MLTCMCPVFRMHLYYELSLHQNPIFGSTKLLQPKIPYSVHGKYANHNINLAYWHGLIKRFCLFGNTIFINTSRYFILKIISMWSQSEIHNFTIFTVFQTLRDFTKYPTLISLIITTTFRRVYMRKLC